MKFEVMISGKMPLFKTIQADNLTSALNMVKNSIVQSDASWDMYPIFEGEKRVTASFKSDGKTHKLIVFNTSFRKE